MSEIERVARNDPSVDSLPVAPDNAQVNEVPSPSLPHRIPSRGIGERVTFGYFDREGVDQLRRTLTHLSEIQEPEVAGAVSQESLSVPPTGPFDFERTLRTIMRKCAVAPRCHPSVTKSNFQAPPCRYSIARAWCLVSRSPCCRLGSRC